MCIPPDIPIGIVVNVGEEDVNSYKDIEVQPFLDFRVLEEVMVLIVPDYVHPRPQGPPAPTTTTTVPIPGTTTTTSVQATSTTTTTR